MPMERQTMMGSLAPTRSTTLPTIRDPRPENTCPIACGISMAFEKERGTLLNARGDRMEVMLGCCSTASYAAVCSMGQEAAPVEHV
jgi:hypothetical protein